MRVDCVGEVEIGAVGHSGAVGFDVAGLQVKLLGLM
jgi:hypothetical protein